MFQKTSGMVQSLLKQYLYLIACLILLGSSHSADNYGYVHTIPDSFKCQCKEIKGCIHIFLFKEHIFTKKIHYQIVLDSK